MISPSERTRRGWPIAEHLGDHPAHRGADDVRRLDPEVVEEPGRVVGHVVERVGEAVAGAEEHRQPPRRRRQQPAREPRVAVVEPDHPEPALGEQLAEPVVPGDQLHAEPHDQDQRLAVGIADLLVGDLDPVRGRDPGARAHPVADPSAPAIGRESSRRPRAATRVPPPDRRRRRRCRRGGRASRAGRRG